MRQAIQNMTNSWSDRFWGQRIPALQAQARRKASRLGSDRVMSLNRLVAGSAMMAALWAMGNEPLAARWSGPVLIWLLCAVAMFLCTGPNRRFSNLKRGTGLILDVSGATIMLCAGGSETAFLYAVYLWIIIGYGFRFGARYLMSASVLSMAGFTLVIANDPFWGTYLTLSLGLLAGLAVLPAYSFALIHELAKARQRAERADRAKTLFLASVSHELRTPLHAIIGTAEALRATSLDNDQAGMIETINTAAEGQIALVSDLLEFAKAESGHGHKAVEEFDLVELIGKVIAIAAVDGQKKGLSISSHITARCPHRLRGDERRIREVLLNLCANAVKFTERGSVTVAADGFLDPDGSVAMRFEVMDTGIGIAPNHLDKVFGLFAQADETIFERFGGTGLGLALCRQQVQLLGGCMGVESTPAAGSTFWISLVLQAAAEAGTSPAPARVLVVANDAGTASALQERLASLQGLAASGFVLDVALEQGQLTRDQAVDALIYATPEPIDGLPSRVIRERFSTSISVQSTGSDLSRAVRISSLQSIQVRAAVTQQAMDNSIRTAELKGYRILVADDNKVNRSVVSKMLSGAGAIVTFATNGEEALAILSEGDVDLGLLDVNMPDMDGIEAAQLYQFAAVGSKRIPLVALTADESTDTQARCLKAGMAACLVKPIRTAPLLDALKAILGSQAAAPAVPVPAPSVKVVPRLNHEALAELEILGGPEFIDQLVSDFKHDCLKSLVSLDGALAQQDVQQFRFEAHSISSAAGNVGARALQHLCSPLSRIAECVFRDDGSRLVALLRREWEETSRDLDRRLTAGAGASPTMGSGDGSQRLMC